MLARSCGVLVGISVDRTKDSTMIVLTPAMVAVEVGSYSWAAGFGLFKWMVGSWNMRDHVLSCEKWSQSASVSEWSVVGGGGRGLDVGSCGRSLA